METIKADLCIIGGGSGGLSVAAGAAQMGADVVLIERGKMGGDCLNSGCVPSKSLLAAAKHAQMMRDANVFGIQSVVPEIDFQAVQDHVHGVISAIAPHDSVERFVSLGVKVIQDEARFISPHIVCAGGYQIKARRFVVATGSSPVAPPIPGLNKIPFLTNETIFDRTELPEHLLVIGGGPIGCELAQAHLMLGAKVTVLEMFSIMPKDDPELVDIVRQNLMRQGLHLYEQIKVEQVEKTAQGVAVTIESNGEKQTITGSHLLVAAGRLPNIMNLGLSAAKIKHTPRGIEVDARLRSSNKRIFAIGDAAGSFQFTHAAGYHAGIVIRNALFHLPAKVNYQAMPWVTYTAPELAHVGLTQQMADAKKLKYKILECEFSDIDRAQAEHDVGGRIKVLVTKKGNILGASIVNSQAGELIAPWCLAIANKLKIGAMASMIVPYPTRGDIHKRVAGEFYKEKLFSSRMKKIVRFLQWF